MGTLRPIALAGAAVVTALFITGCQPYGENSEESGKDNAAAQEPQPPPQNPQVPAPADSQQPVPPAYPGDGGQDSPPPAQTGGDSVRTTQNPQLGTILVGRNGRTIYRFDKDTANPSKSNCAGDCLTAWPPAKHSQDMKIQGVNRAQIGNIVRPDGICQLTVGGWPMYYYSKDTAPGQVNGQGVDGKWFVAAPDGSKAGNKNPGQNENQYPGQNGNQQNSDQQQNHNHGY